MLKYVKLISDFEAADMGQGLAFLNRYRKLSAQDAVTQEEVEYNYGRCFYQLGEWSSTDEIRFGGGEKEGGR